MKTYPLSAEDKELVNEAFSLAKIKETPGGLVREVGCALRTKKGKIFRGVSLDLTCGIGFCAEHSAIAGMITNSDETEIDCIVACSSSRKKPVISPCGRCREMMNVIDKENYLNTFVIVSEKQKVKLGELLPFNWMDGRNK